MNVQEAKMVMAKMLPVRFNNIEYKRINALIFRTLPDGELVTNAEIQDKNYHAVLVVPIDRLESCNDIEVEEVLNKEIYSSLIDAENNIRKIATSLSQEKLEEAYEILTETMKEMIDRSNELSNMIKEQEDKKEDL